MNFIYLLLYWAATAASYLANWTSKLGSLCTKYNYKYIALLNTKFNYSHFNTRHSQKQLMDLDLRVRIIWDLQDLQPKDFAVIYYDPSNPFSYKDWQVLSQRQVKTSLIITQLYDMDILLSDINKANQNLNVFCLAYTEIKEELKQIMALRNQEKILEFSAENDATTKVDLQGITIISIVANYLPYFEQTQEFKNKGFAVDFLNEASKVMNFTWKVEVDPSENWENISRNVEVGNYAFSANQWLWFYERFQILDFVTVYR